MKYDLGMEAPTVDDVVQLARKLSPIEKLQVIERLAPDLEAPLTSSGHATSQSLDDLYQRGYERVPEDAAEAEALLKYLPLSEDTW